MKAEWTNKDSMSIESTGQKAILVIDMPKTCEGCEYCGYAIIDSHEQEEYRYRSCALSKSYIGEIEKASRYIGCPLRPMPQEMKLATEPYICNNDWQNGWNECLDEIMGETE